jgi:hypothetical protein
MTKNILVNSMISWKSAGQLDMDVISPLYCDYIHAEG